MIDTLSYDTNHLGSMPLVPYFVKQTTKIAESVRNLDEKPAVKMIFDNQNFSKLLFGKIFPVASRVACSREVKYNLLSTQEKNSGDADILAVVPGLPFSCTAIQTKVVKIDYDAESTELKVNKIAELQHGAFQTKKQMKHGFAFNYFAAIFVLDARNIPAANVFATGISNYYRNLIIRNVIAPKLRREAGLIFMYLTQSMDKTIDEAGQFGAEIIRYPTSLEQPADLTASIERYFSVADNFKLCETRKIH